MPDVILFCELCDMPTGHTHIIDSLHICVICGNKKYPGRKSKIPTKQLITMTSEGKSVKEIAESFKVSPQAVYMKMRELEITPQKVSTAGTPASKKDLYLPRPKERKQRPLTTGKRHLAAHQAAELIELKEKGWTPAELAEKYGITVQTVYYRMKKAGIGAAETRGIKKRKKRIQ